MSNVIEISEPSAASANVTTVTSRNKLKKPNYACCVPRCKNKTSNSTGVEFYRFPTSNPHFPHRNARLNEWLRILRLKQSGGSQFIPTNKDRVCSAHFVGNIKSEDPRSPNFNPSSIPPVHNKPNVKNEQALSRYKRFKKRASEQIAQHFNIKRKKKNLTSADNLPVEMCDKTTELPDEHCNDHDSSDVLEDIPVKVEFGVQTDIWSMDEIVQDTFICNRYIFPTSCEAETQCNAAGSNGKVKIEFTTKNEEKIPMATSDKCSNGFHGYESIKDEQSLIDIAGVSRATFKLFHKILLKDKQQPALDDWRKKITDENRILVFLMKMKLGMTFSALSVFFQVHRTTISRIFYTTLDYYYVACQNFVRWPDKLVIQETMPAVFEEEYPNCRVIIDATEFCVEQPPSTDEQVQFFSTYKKGYRIKIVVGCTPAGLISLVSQSHGGRGTDAQITVASKLLKLLEPGDQVLADKGFPQIQSMLDEKGGNVLLVMPPFLSNDEQFTEEQVDETYKVASVRIHIERIMQRIRTHKIVDKLTTEMLPYIDKIIFLTCVLVNLQHPIIKTKS